MPEDIASPQIAEVALEGALKKTLDYRIPNGLFLKVGMRVRVPLKSSTKIATVVKLKNSSAFPKIKPIFGILEEKGNLSPTLFKLAEWMSYYYITPISRVLKNFVPSAVKNDTKEKKLLFLKLKKGKGETVKEIVALRAKFPRQAEALDRLLKLPQGAFFKDLNLSRSAISSLIKKGWIEKRFATLEEDLEEEERFFSPPKGLSEEQKTCLDAILPSIREKKFAAHLIYGVTGSGKTEIYMQAIQEVLSQGKSAIILVPEVSLTSQTIERFRSRFREKIVVLHHKRSFGQRAEAWQMLKRGDAKLVIGARSALFAPAQNLGLIVVDEEHDPSYKQSEEMPCYHGRDCALMRGLLEGCPVLLGSATPSIESRYNAKIGKYQLHTLQKRATQASLPKVHIVDMQQELERQGGFTHFSQLLLGGIKERLEKGEQTLLFLNRRGYYRMQICPECQHVIKCPHCDLSLTFHKGENLLECHLCGHKNQVSLRCPACQKTGPLKFRGFGTEHVEKSLQALLPEVRTLRMDRDTTQKTKSHEEIFQRFRAHKADVLIGTQMIAKGFHFPSVTLVGILNPDAALHIPDFRSPEVAFQLLTQVAGRAGRAKLCGEVIIQTFLPHHPTITLASAQDYPAFYQKELEERRSFFYPPFCHLIKLLFKDKDEKKAQAFAENAHQKIKKNLPPHAQLFPVLPAGHFKAKDFYRFQFFLKTTRTKELFPLLQQIEGARIDVDPLSLFF